MLTRNYAAGLGAAYLPDPVHPGSGEVSPGTRTIRQSVAGPLRAAPHGDAGPGGADLDLVIPAYNEERRIGPTVERICWQMQQSGLTARIIVVDNGSVDATTEAVDGATRHGMQVSVISCRSQGKGSAVKAGVREATAPFVGYIDADLSTPPEVLVTGWAILRTGWDVVVGSRRVFGADYVVPQDIVRRAGSRVFNLAASTIVGRMSDTQCGMKLFRTDLAQEVFAKVVLEGFAFDVEVLARAEAAGARIMEIPVSWSDSHGSTFRPIKHGIHAFGELNRLRRVLRHPVG